MPPVTHLTPYPRGLAHLALLTFVVSLRAVEEEAKPLVDERERQVHNEERETDLGWGGGSEMQITGQQAKVARWREAGV